MSTDRATPARTKQVRKVVLDSIAAIVVSLALTGSAMAIPTKQDLPTGQRVIEEQAHVRMGIEDRAWLERKLQTESGYRVLVGS